MNIHVIVKVQFERRVCSSHSAILIVCEESGGRYMYFFLVSMIN